MSIRQIAILFAALTLAACGGGGGGDSPAGGNDGDAGGGDAGGGDGGGGGAGDGSSDPNGTAQIVFPWANSAATASTVSIRGFASDPDGVASVSVNGVPATITATGAVTTQKVFRKGNLEEGEVASRARWERAPRS